MNSTAAVATPAADDDGCCDRKRAASVTPTSSHKMPKMDKTSDMPPLEDFLVNHLEVFTDKLAPFLLIPDMFTLGKVVLKSSEKSSTEAWQKVQWPCYECPHKTRNVLAHVGKSGNEHLPSGGNRHCLDHPLHYQCAKCANAMQHLRDCKQDIGVLPYGITDNVTAQCPGCERMACECRPLLHCHGCRHPLPCKLCTQNPTIMKRLENEEDGPVMCEMCNEEPLALCKTCYGTHYNGMSCNRCGVRLCESCDVEVCAKAECSDCRWAGCCANCEESNKIECVDCKQEFHEGCFEDDERRFCGTTCNQCYERICYACKDDHESKCPVANPVDGRSSPLHFQTFEAIAERKASIAERLNPEGAVEQPSIVHHFGDPSTAVADGDDNGDDDEEMKPCDISPSPNEEKEDAQLGQAMQAWLQQGAKGP